MAEIKTEAVKFTLGLRLTEDGPIFLEGPEKVRDGIYAYRKFVNAPSDQKYWVIGEYTAGDPKDSAVGKLSIFDTEEKDKPKSPEQKPLLYLHLNDLSSFGTDEATIVSSLEEVCLGCENLLNQGKTLDEIRDYYKPPQDSLK